jgi:hypothetical protein
MGWAKFVGNTEYEAYDQANGWTEGEESAKDLMDPHLCDIHPPIMAPIFTGPVVSQQHEIFARTRKTDACQRLKGPWVRGRREQAWRGRDAEAAAQSKADSERCFVCM